MSKHPEPIPHGRRETILRVAVLGTIYALAVGFVVAMSPSMGLVTYNTTGEDRVAEAPGEARR